MGNCFKKRKSNQPKNETQRVIAVKKQALSPYFSNPDDNVYVVEELYRKVVDNEKTKTTSSINQGINNTRFVVCFILFNKSGTKNVKRLIK